MTSRATPWLAALLAAVLLAPAAASAFEEARPGDALPNPQLPTADGRHAPLLGDAPASLFLFVRLHQPQSKRALEIAADLQRDLGQRVRIVAVFPGNDDRELALAAVRAVGATFPVLMDTDDALAAKLGVFTVPVAGIADAGHRLVAAEYFTTIRYAEALQQGVALALAPPADAPTRVAQAGSAGR